MKKIADLLIVAAIVMVCSSCSGGWSAGLLGDDAPFGAWQDSIDTVRQVRYLREIIKADEAKGAADMAVRQRYDSLLEDYAQVPLWYTEDEGVSSDAYEVADYLRSELAKDGFRPQAFLLDDIDKDLATVSHLAFDSLGVDINEVLVRLDYNLTKAYVRYASGQRYGFTQPEKMLNRLYFREDRGYYAHLYDYETAHPDYEELLRQVSDGGRIDFLRQSYPANEQVYSALREHLVEATDSAARLKTLASMERCRWRIKHPTKDERCVIVNLPSQQLWARGGAGATSMKICCGAWDTKTPLLCSEISYLQVNPEWSLPPKIVESDFSRHVGDSAWFARHSYFVVNRRSGDTLNIAHIGLDGMKNQGLRFVQRGGRGNSLGRIVFRFASQFSIYLHDTNQPYVFERDRRTVSHGCIRVERPFDLACYLLPDADEWTLEKMRISMDIPPISDRGREWLSKHADDARPYKLLTYHAIRPKVPVYITYYTMYPNPETGVVEQWPDFYGYDKPTLAAMEGLLMDF